MRTFENLVFNWSVDNLPMELEPNPFTQSSGSTKNLNERDESLAAIEITTLAIIFLLALIGNLFVLIALWRQMKFRSPSRMYLFMMHLSIADVLVAIFNILPQMLWKITFRFQGGDLLCRAVKYMQVMVLYLSTYILVMMAVDRYRAVCWTSNLYWNSVKLAKVMVVIAWIMSLVFAVPQPFIFRITQLPSNDSKVIQDCWATFVEPWGGKAYVTWFVLAAFIMPLMILSFCYGVICYKIWTYNPDKSHTSSSQARQNSACPSDNPLVTSKQNGDCRRVQQEISSVLTPQRSVHLRRNGRNQISHAKMKTIKLTLIVIICFFFCWAPFCVTQLVMAYSPTKQASPIESVILLLAALNSCTNPWIYLAFSGSLVNHLRVCIGIGTRRFRDNDSIGDEEPEPKQHQKPKPNHPSDHQPHASAKRVSTKSDLV